MAEITAKMVSELRETTGAGMMDCKKALTEAGGSMEEAIEILRKKGLKDIGKRAGRVAAEGIIGVYIHHGSQIVSVVELNCETDFVARGDEFKDLANNLAMHIAAATPQYLSSEDIPAAVVEKEKEIYLEQLTEAQRKNADKILPGKIEKFFEENCLLNQVYVKDPEGKKTVKLLVDELAAKTGEKFVIRRFARYQVGEGIEKQQSNIAEEVAKMTASA